MNRKLPYGKAAVFLCVHMAGRDGIFLILGKEYDIIKEIKNINVEYFKLACKGCRTAWRIRWKLKVSAQGKKGGEGGKEKDKNLQDKVSRNV